MVLTSKDGYDANHNQINKTDSKGTTNYTYDVLNRLETIKEPITNLLTQYTYDASGNRIQESKIGGTSKITTYEYDERNRLLKTNETNTFAKEKSMVKYTYDNNGNMLQSLKETTKDAVPNEKPKFGMFVSGQGATQNASVMMASYYKYDEFNRMIRATGEKTVEFQYNGEDLRVGKTVNGEKTSFFYEYDKVVLELDKEGRQIAKNTYGMNLLKRNVNTFEGESQSPTTSNSFYYMYNGHGDVTALIDVVSKAISATYYYDAFGNITESTGNVNNSVTYAGYQYDKETDLYYLNARYYNSKTAQFLSEDTFGGSQTDPLSLNRYSYCHNNPHKYIDVNGHNPLLIGAAAGVITLYVTDVIFNIIKNGGVSQECFYKGLSSVGSYASAAITGAASVFYGGIAGSVVKIATEQLGASGAKALAATVVNVIDSVGGAVIQELVDAKREHRSIDKDEIGESILTGMGGNLLGDLAGKIVPKTSTDNNTLKNIVGEREGGAFRNDKGLQAEVKKEIEVDNFTKSVFVNKEVNALTSKTVDELDETDEIISQNDETINPSDDNPSQIKESDNILPQDNSTPVASQDEEKVKTIVNANVGGVTVGNAQLSADGITTGYLTDIINGLGGTTYWDEASKTATVVVNGQTITYDLNSIQNGVGTASDGTKFTIENDKVQVGIRSVSESAGAKVD